MYHSYLTSLSELHRFIQLMQHRYLSEVRLLILKSDFALKCFDFVGLLTSLFVFPEFPLSSSIKLIGPVWTVTAPVVEPFSTPPMLQSQEWLPPSFPPAVPPPATEDQLYPYNSITRAPVRWGCWGEAERCTIALLHRSTAAGQATQRPPPTVQQPCTTVEVLHHVMSCRLACQRKAS